MLTYFVENYKSIIQSNSVLN